MARWGYFDFCRDVAKTFALLGCYIDRRFGTAWSAWPLKMGAEKLSQNNGDQLPTYAALHPKKAKALHVCSFHRTLQNSVDAVATRYELDSLEIESGWRRDFLHPYRPVLGATYPPAEWAPGFFPRGKEAGTRFWPSTPASAEVKEIV
jgi:hypothetical protein